MNDNLKLGDPVLLDRGAGAGGWIVGMDDTYVVVDSGVFNIQVLRETVVYDPSRAPCIVQQ